MEVQTESQWNSHMPFNVCLLLFTHYKCKWTLLKNLHFQPIKHLSPIQLSRHFSWLMFLIVWTLELAREQLTWWGIASGRKDYLKWLRGKQWYDLAEMGTSASVIWIFWKDEIWRDMLLTAAQSGRTGVFESLRPELESRCCHSLGMWSLSHYLSSHGLSVTFFFFKKKMQMVMIVLSVSGGFKVKWKRIFMCPTQSPDSGKQQ